MSRNHPISDLPTFYYMRCLNGPARYKALGYKKYATKELFTRSPIVLKPVAGLAGIGVDGGVLALDSFTLPFFTIWYTLTSGLGPDGDSLKDFLFSDIESGYYEKHPLNTITKIVLSPFVFTTWYTLGLMGIPIVAEKDFYQEYFGIETGLFANKPDNPNPSGTQ